MAREDGFLSRWSRLKKEASRQAPPPPTEAEQAAARARIDAFCAFFGVRAHALDTVWGRTD